MKADKREIEMTCWDDWELRTALGRIEMKSVDESVVVEFGTVDNLGDNQFRYKYDSLTFDNVHITKNAVEMCEQVYGIDYCYTCTKGLL